MYLRSVPGNKVHAVCKMHQINCAGILGCCATNFETRPRFHVIFVIFFTDLFNVFLFFAGRNTAGCSTKYILWIFKKGPPQAPLFSVPSIWKPFKNRRYTLKQKHIYVFPLFSKVVLFIFVFYYFFSFFFILLYLYYYFYYFCCSCFFMMFIYLLVFTCLFLCLLCFTLFVLFIFMFSLMCRLSFIFPFVYSLFYFFVFLYVYVFYFWSRYLFIMFLSFLLFYAMSFLFTYLYCFHFSLFPRKFLK